MWQRNVATKDWKEGERKKNKKRIERNGLVPLLPLRAI
jgi:hypothetical protein